MFTDSAYTASGNELVLVNFSEREYRKARGLGSSAVLANLSMLLDGEGVDYRKSSVLQGALMERLDTEYVDFLHSQQMHPYSQYVSITEDGPVWHIQTLNAEAYENMIKKFMEGPFSFTLRHIGKEISIRQHQVKFLKKSDLLEEFYHEPASHSFQLEFLTPTAFRQNGRYVILPDIRLLCQSLMLKYSASSGMIDMMDEEALEQIVENSFITRHRIQSKPFPLEGTTIPGFMGSVTFRCKGTETMARYLRLLLTFGEFSGVGVKTAVGMGAMRVRRDGNE